jgi:hypothetical protein
MVRIAVRIGPRQGVQPKAKAKPITNAPIGVLLPFTLCSRASVYSALILKIPVRCNPKIIMTTPPPSPACACKCQAPARSRSPPPQGDEHHAEAQDESHRVHHNPPHQVPCGDFQFLDARPRNQRDVARYQRQHARRKKRNQAREETRQSSGVEGWTSALIVPAGCRGCVAHPLLAEARTSPPPPQ